ncbi:Xaa-Pro peptidase family protein [Xinfangfangia sp. CPCC 101601]|uniref:Xaa-Pro peptidase family protein n=1 Tax=Pseudogemmobacter lacusdianii TaxID=3069608 RepID=A0ABU0VVI1_9RHOB|nr:Xaa-Pro peptidase family protein [Xinfangfangia sp. CPCC 101601]MDQ2065751.1 Xaa-Pro peptidase family protein [Xinfangfangia sp. CPCC 101601]
MSTPTNRLPLLQAKMRENSIDLVALAPTANMTWAVGLRPMYMERTCILLVGQDNVVALMPELDLTTFQEHLDIPAVTLRDELDPAVLLAEAVALLGAKNVARVSIDETMRADHALLVVKAFPGADFESSEKLMSQVRTCKDAVELAALAAIAEINDKAMEAAFAAIAVGKSEFEVLNEVKAAFAAEGAELNYYVVGTGANGAKPHHHTGTDLIQEGDAIVIDIAGNKGDYYSDMTRMAVVGTAPEGYAEIHGIVEQAVQAALAAAKPGAKAHEVDDAARGVITAAGYGEYFTHRTGHGIGLDVHEGPFITASSQVVLQPGMAFTIEPGIYLPGRFGVRLEEIAVITETGCRILSRLPRDTYWVS